MRKSVLVFFDDFLVYSKDVNTHMNNLTKVFTLMKQNMMFAKESKCVFVTNKEEYLGYFISANGVEIEPKMIAAISNWPVPSTLKDLRSFLRFSCYYKKFIRNYVSISKDLTNLLKKGAFKWTEQANVAFETLKLALTTAPVLAVPNFSLPFVLEIDASKFGIGVVLMQQGHPLAYISRSLCPKWHKLSVYEKELLAIVFSVKNWEQYLIAGYFVIKLTKRA